MAGPVRERVTDADRRHFDFVQTLLRISDDLTEEETANVKLFCLHLIPKGQAAQLKRAVDVFQKLMELDKIDQENLDFLKEILERIGRQDLIQNVLRGFQPPDREIPENPELQPENPEMQPATSQEGGSAEGNAYLVVHGEVRMIQENLDRLRNRLATLSGTRRSQVKFRGYKKHKSILVHFSMPRENTAVLRHMADHSDPRLVYMGVKSLQIDAEVPIKVQQRAPVYDFKRHQPVDDIEVGCGTRNKHQRPPQSWTRLSALNLFSDALPLHLQAAASLEYQGFSYSLVRALVQKDRLREHQMRQAIQNLRNAEVDSNTLRQKAEVDSNTLRQNAEVDSNTLRQKAEVDSNTLRQKAEVDSNTIMTLRSKLNITENRLKEALETIAVLEEKLQQAQEYAEKAAKQVTSHVTEYRGEKPPGGWPQEYRGEKPPGGWPQEYRGEKPPGGSSAQVEKSDSATQKHLAGPVYTTERPEDVGDKVGGDLTVQEEDKRSARQDSGIGREDVLGSEAPMQERRTARLEVTASRLHAHGDMKQRVINFGGKGSEPGKFDYPRGVVVSPSNEIFVADIFNRRVQVHGTEGVYLRYFPTVVPGTGDKDMKPDGVCMDGNGTLWVVGGGKTDDHVVQYSTDGTAMAGFGLKNCSYYRGIAVDMRTNHILITDADQGEVLVFRPDGSLVRTVRHPRGWEMTRPRYITVDGEGNILVSDYNSNSAYVYDESGKFLFQFGGEGSGEGQLWNPAGICTDSSGHILVADSLNGRVQIFTRHGEFVRTVRTVSNPEGLAVGPEGQLVVTNYPDDTVTVYHNY